VHLDNPFKQKPPEIVYPDFGHQALSYIVALTLAALNRDGMVAGNVGEAGVVFSSCFSLNSTLWSFLRCRIAAVVLLLPCGPVILYVCVAGKH
jgi:hypothetical protein